MLVTVVPKMCAPKYIERFSRELAAPQNQLSIIRVNGILSSLLCPNSHETGRKRMVMARSQKPVFGFCMTPYFRAY
jgi:hypothetical protein